MARMHRKYLIRRFLLYFLIIVTPFLLFGSAYLFYTSRSLRVSIEQDALTSLTTVRDNLDLVMDNATYQQSLLSASPRFALSLQKLLRQEKMNYDDGVILNAINSFLYSAVNSKLYIKSIYVYIDGCGRFLSSADGLVYADEALDASWLAQYDQSDATHDLWVTKRAYRASRLLPESNVISVFLRLKTTRGVIVINIDPARFGSILDRAQTHEEQMLYILSEDETLLFSNATGEKMLAQAPDMLRLPSSGAGTQKRTVNGEPFLCQTLDLSGYHLSLVSMISQRAAYRLVTDFLNLFSWLAVGISLLALLVAYLITRHNFRQIHSILHAFDTGEGLEPCPDGITQNEYDIILQNIVRMYIHSNQLKLELAEQKVQQKNAEMVALQMQINPHFLFNTLQTLDLEATAGMGPHNRVSWVIGELSNILQYALGSADASVTLADELRYLRSYASIQAYRYDDKFSMHYQVEQSALQTPVFRMLLQPLVENSLYHGIKPRQRHCDIWIQVRREGEKLRFRVMDNGVGMSAERLEAVRAGMGNSRNIGLFNVNQRLALKYGPDSALHIASQEGMGTVISFAIPLARR